MDIKQFIFGTYQGVSHIEETQMQGGSVRYFVEMKYGEPIEIVIDPKVKMSDAETISKIREAMLGAEVEKGEAAAAPPDKLLTAHKTKQIRAAIQEIVNYLNSLEDGSRERSLAITKLQEGKMWLGQELGNLGGEDLNAKRDAEELSKKK